MWDSMLGKVMQDKVQVFYLNSDNEIYHVYQSMLWINYVYSALESRYDMFSEYGIKKKKKVAIKCIKIQNGLKSGSG